MNQFQLWIFTTNWFNAFIFFLVMNVIIFIIALTGGNLLVKKFMINKVCKTPEGFSNSEVFLVFSTVLLNALVTLAGWFLWKLNFIKLNPEINLMVFVDVCKLFFTMDFLMYVLHRIAHLKAFYWLLHKTHHSFVSCKPLTLFALNPLENLSFGLLWLLVLCLYSTSWIAISIYLSLNVLFGVIGHLGVEFIPPKLANNPFLKYFTTSTFHAFHHQDINHNFGFYTTLWDKLFKSLSPVYFSYFGKIPPQNLKK